MIPMSEKEFLYAARVEGGKKAEEHVKAYIAANPKDDYGSEDWMKAMNVKRGFKIMNRPGWSSMHGGGKTTRYSHKCGLDKD